MGESNVELVKGVYEAFARGDLAAALAAMADDIEWHEADGGPYAGVHRGPDQVAAKVLRPVAGDVPDFAATPEEVITSGRTVAVIGRYTGTGRATGMKLDLPVVHIWDVHEGKIASFRQFVDGAAFQEVVAPDDRATA